MRKWFYLILEVHDPTFARESSILLPGDPIFFKINWVGIRLFQLADNIPSKCSRTIAFWLHKQTLFADMKKNWSKKLTVQKYNFHPTSKSMSKSCRPIYFQLTACRSFLSPRTRCFDRIQMGHSQFYSYIVEDSKKSSFIKVRFVVSENTSTKDCFIYILIHGRCCSWRPK